LSINGWESANWRRAHDQNDIERIKHSHVLRRDTGEVLYIDDREAWCLAELIVNGDRGVTPIERPAPQWSDDVSRFRKRGLPVQTIEEAHGRPYRGHHARYRLDVQMTVLETEFAA
jgi:hypothetical protein